MKHCATFLLVLVTSLVLPASSAIAQQSTVAPSPSPASTPILECQGCHAPGRTLPYLGGAKFHTDAHTAYDRGFHARGIQGGMRAATCLDCHTRNGDMTTILQAALHLQDELRLHFMFIGGGIGKKDVEDFIRTHNLTNCIALPYQPLADLRLAVKRILSGERWITSSLLSRLTNSEPPRPHPTSVTSLTRRQRELLRLLTQGADNRSIASELNISVKTVENHLTALYRILGVDSRLKAMNYAIHHPEILASNGQDMVDMETIARSENSLTILVVDDNATNRRILEGTLRNWKMKPVVVEGGAAALQALLDARPHSSLRVAGPDDVVAVRRLRTRLRRVFESSDEAEAVAILNALLAEAGALPQLTDHDGEPWHLHFTPPDAPLAHRLAAEAAMGLAVVIRDGGFDRLRVCAQDDCDDAFVDASRNRSRRYCDPATCGNRAHVAAYRARRRSARAASAQ